MLTFEQFAITESAYGEFDVAKSIITTLRNGGFLAYLVGGCVRDKLLGKTPKDYDVATDATPVQVLHMFPKADKVGATFGVVIERGVEIATFRSDSDAGDGRRPDAVHFEKSPREDAARRDFTVNAMFMDPFTGHILDFFGGQEDIKHKVLRAVGDPYQRFHQDHLRMLRAVRFASKLGFTIDPDTMSAMKGMAPHIRDVATERVRDEITGALSFAGGPLRTYSYLHSTGMLTHILPELDALSFHEVTSLTNVLRQIHVEGHAFALAALLSPLAVGVVQRILLRLKVTNDEQKHILSVLEMQHRIAAATEHTTMDVLKRLLREPYFADALKLYGLRAPDHSFHFLTNLAAGMSREELHPEKFVTGDDLVRLGYRPGKAFKNILDTVENLQLTGHLHSKTDALAYVQAHFGNPA